MKLNRIVNILKRSRMLSPDKVFNRQDKKKDYSAMMLKEPVQEEQPYKEMLSPGEVKQLRTIASEYSEDLPEVLRNSELIGPSRAYCNEAIALLMVLSQAYVGSYPQYATRYWSVFTDNSEVGINMELVKAVHQAIGGQLVELINDGVEQL